MTKSLTAALALTTALSLTGAALAQEAPAQRTSTDWTRDSGWPRAPEQVAMQFDKADLAFRILPETKSIEGVATLDFTATAPLPRLVLDLDTRFDVSAITVDGRALPRTAWTNPQGRMTITLPRPVAVGRSVQVRIAYAGVPHPARNAPWDGGWVWRTAPSGEPWIATAVQGDGCDMIWPCIDWGTAEPRAVDMHITVPSNLAAPGPGRFVGKTDNGDGTTTWNWSAGQMNTYAISINVGPFIERTATYRSRFGNDIQMSYWHLKSDDPAKVEDLFAEFPLMLQFFEEVVGPYPFADEKLGVVETPHLGMEHQTLNAYGNQYRKDHKGYDWLLHHEMAHEWFGNQLTHVDLDDIWLHEGLGTYMQPLYLRWLHGDRIFQAELLEQRLGLGNEYPIVSGKEITDEGTSQAGPGNDVYSKASLVAHTLRNLIGDEAFFRSIRLLVYGRDDPRPGNFEPRFASTRDYMAIVNQVTGQDLDWFFEGYLYQAAIPDLVETRDGDRLRLEWKTGNGAPFPLPVEIEVAGRVQVVPMTGGRGEIALPAGAHYVVDPYGKVLRQSDVVDEFEAWQAAQRRRQ
ncbi:MAG TPA: M1 family metallopeptidase [Brevundimonas sp.]|jgi:aminopeptidase N|uniref:M1 family metallopeptidase n=1 Tax=Brevundimonas sp. TaxID=1871086 RepID=UPI002DF24BE2|nr:M1 family metallopeptidase [Brevundimonas sp.]